jgi:hypothetical protein
LGLAVEVNRTDIGDLVLRGAAGPRNRLFDAGRSEFDDGHDANGAGGQECDTESANLRGHSSMERSECRAIIVMWS